MVKIMKAEKKQFFIIICLCLSVWMVLATDSIYCQPSVGSEAPTFKLLDVFGRPFNLDHMKDRQVVVLYFFDAKSKASRAGLINLNQLYLKYKNSELIILGITASPKNQIIEFVTQADLEFPVLIDKDEVIAAFQAQFILPTTYILGPGLKVMNSYQGGGGLIQNTIHRIVSRILDRYHAMLAKKISRKVENESEVSLNHKTTMEYSALKTNKKSISETSHQPPLDQKTEFEYGGKEELSTSHDTKVNSNVTDQILQHDESRESQQSGADSELPPPTTMDDVASLKQQDVKLDVVCNVQGARVWIDDEDIGTTPFSPVSVTPGLHILRVEKPSYESYQSQIQFEAGGTHSVYVHLAMTKKKPARLFVDTRPIDAIVKILNTESQFHQGIELSPGSYELEISNDGYEKETREVNLSTGEEKEVYVKLKKEVREANPSTGEEEEVYVKLKKETKRNISLIVISEVTGKLYLDNNFMGKITRKWTKIKPFLVENVSKGNHTLKIDSGSYSDIYWEGAIESDSLLFYKNQNFKLLDCKQPEGWWQVDVLRSPSWDSIESIQVTRKNQDEWNWKAIGSGQGWANYLQTPRSSLINDPADVYKYLFPNEARCVKGREYRSLGEKCSFVILSDDGLSMKIYKGNEVIGTAKRILY